MELATGLVMLSLSSMVVSRRARALAPFVTALAIAGAPRLAHADDAEPEERVAATERTSGVPADDDGHAADLLVTGGTGAFTDGDNTGGVLTLTVLRQAGPIGYGGLFEYGGAIFDYTHVTAAPMIGIFAPSPRWLRAGAAVTAGVHVYEGVGRGFLSSDPGVDGTMPFAGIRGFIGGEIGGKARLHLGLQLSADTDLARRERTSSYRESSWSSSATYERTATHTIGFVRTGAALALGGAFDL